jgi:hypothetical protein
MNMDKLKPILAQKFWILSALCVILALTGWWISTAGGAAEFEARKGKIKAAYDAIPKPGPNKNWTSRVEALNKDEEAKVTETGLYLWNNQLPLMTWPEEVAPGVKDAVTKFGYRGEIDAKTRGDYRYVYDQELIDLRNIISPFDPTDGSGLVDMSPDLIPNLQLGMAQNPPTFKEMWDIQEDIWLYRALLQAIANINTPPNTNSALASTSIVDSKIKQIVVLELRGGTPGGGLKAGAAAGGAAGAPSMLPPGGAGAGAAATMLPPGVGGAGAGKMSMPPGGMIGGGMMGADSTLTASFDPAEQLGPDADTAAGGAPGGGASPTSSSPPPGAGTPGAAASALAMPPAGMLGGMGMGGGASGGPRKRYIDKTDRYVTRGFYMELVMDHRQLPEFISELSDSPWPLRVIRVQAVDRDLADIDAGNVVGMGGAGMTSRKKMMTSANMANALPPRAGGEGGAGRLPPRVTGPLAGGEGGVTSGDAVNLQVALSDPYLVNVAISGMFTLYLPPAPATAAPGAPGAPAATPPPSAPGAAPTPGAPGATTPPATTPPATAGGATPPAAGATPPAAAAGATPPVPGAPANTGVVPAAPAAEKAATAPAADAAKPAAAAPGAAPPAAPATPPAAGSTPPAATTPPPADPAKPPPAAAGKAAGT